MILNIVNNIYNILIEENEITTMRKILNKLNLPTELFFGVINGNIIDLDEELNNTTDLKIIPLIAGGD